MMISRRNTIALGLCAAAATLMPAWAGETETLDAAGRRKGRRFGTAIGARHLKDTAYAALVARECGLIVPENEMKWQALRPAPDRFDFSGADTLVDFAKANGLGMRGHTLLWVPPQWFPKWLETYDFGARPATEAARLLTEHVAAVCDRYKGVVSSFDVVNEAVDPETGALRANPFTKHLDPVEMIDLAFRTAKRRAPEAELVYNDYMGWGTNPKHRDGVIALLEKLKAKGTPVDALGLQSHLGGDGVGEDTDWVAAEGEWKAFLEKATAMGHDLLITELDVNDRRLPADIATRDAQVADYARRFLDLTLSFPQCKTVMAWGLADKYSWLRERGPRADGLPKRPTPYDDDLKPKAFRTALATALAG